jgi:TetR/AcrR family transcriptional repressor of mexJK operon
MARTTSSVVGENIDLRIAKSMKTRGSVVAAATELFLSEGYSNTSLDRVASAAGVTKPTVYSHFKSKEGLLEAVIQNFSSRPLQEISGFLQPSDDPRIDLTNFGDYFMARIFEKDAMRFRRLAIAESKTHPNVGAAFYAAGPGMLLTHLAKYFDQQTKAGRLDVSKPKDCAEQFVGMLIGLDLLRTQIGQTLPSPTKRRRRCRETVEVCMAIYGAKSC